MEKLLRFLKEQNDFCPSDDQLFVILSSVLPETSRLLDETELETIQAARSALLLKPQNTMNDDSTR